MIDRDEVRQLFERRDAAARALNAAEAAVKLACRDWSEAHGMRVPLRPESLRQLVAA